MILLFHTASCRSFFFSLGGEGHGSWCITWFASMAEQFCSLFSHLSYVVLNFTSGWELEQFNELSWSLAPALRANSLHAFLFQRLSRHLSLSNPECPTYSASSSPHGSSRQEARSIQVKNAMLTSLAVATIRALSVVPVLSDEMPSLCSRKCFKGAGN